MSVITREILNPNLIVNSSIRQEDGSISRITKTYSDIIHDINCAKTYLVNEQNAKAGQKVLLCENAWPHFLIWFIACSELGLGFVFLDKVNISNYESLANKINAYKDVDHIIAWPHGILGINIQKFHSDIIHVGSYGFYRSPMTRPDASADVMLATSDTILFHIMSDGIPQISTHTHEYVYKLMERNIALYGLTEDDVCLHTTGFLEKSTPVTYMLPALNKCKSHFYITPDGSNLESFIQTNNITYSMQTKFGINNRPIFETPETLGPVLLDQQVLDNFFGIYLDKNNFLAIKKPDGTVIVTNTVFEQVNDSFILISKPSITVINNTEIDTVALTTTVSNFTKAVPGVDFDLYIYNDRIYIKSQIGINLALLNSFIVTTLLLTEYLISQQVSEASPDWLKIS
jgi:hypothetical protein